MISFIYINNTSCSEYWEVNDLQSMDITIKLWNLNLFSVSTWIFQIAFLENGDAKTPLIICSHFD